MTNSSGRDCICTRWRKQEIKTKKTKHWMFQMPRKRALLTVVTKRSKWNQMMLDGQAFENCWAQHTKKIINMIEANLLQNCPVTSKT